MRRFVTAVITFVVIVAIMVGAGFVVWRLIRPQLNRIWIRDNQEIVAFHDHFDLDPDVPALIVEGVRLREGTPPLIHNGEAYLPLSFVRAFIDPFLFWDEGAHTLFVTTRRDMRTFTRNQVRFTEDDVFIPSNIVMGLYPYTVAYHPEYNMVVVTDDRVPQTTAALTAQTIVRYRPDAQAPGTTQLPSGERLVLVEDENGANPNWTRVRTSTGLLGYVPNDALGAGETRLVPVDRAPIFSAFIDNLQPHSPNWEERRKINMVWENVYHPDANIVNMQTPLPDNLTVVSPTWFRFNAETMALDSVANRDYVQWAHEQGIQVWPNVSDAEARQAGIQAILSDASARQRIVEQLVQFTEELNLDGLSINIEHIFDFHYGPYFVQFIRELNIALGDRIVLLAAMKVCPYINAHYRHDLVALTIDFIALMTYDEHAGSSPEAGPVASLPWVDRHVREMLLRVPANQLLMGLPFYNRVWRVGVVDNAMRGPLHIGMDRARELFAQHEVEWVWDDDIGSYYGEFADVVNGETLRHRLWLECERSLEMKMHIYALYNLAGVAGWTNGFANDGVWELMGRYFPSNILMR